MNHLIKYSAFGMAGLLVFAPGAFAGEIEVRSNIDAVTVYPDGATVTRVIKTDLPKGDTTVVARDFPVGLDPASIRIEGAGLARFAIGTIDSRVPRPQPNAALPEIEKKIEPLQDERAVLQDKISAQRARKEFIERFARQVPLGLGDKADARPLADWRSAWKAVTDDLEPVDAAIREAGLRQREIDRQLVELRNELREKPSEKLEIRIELTADAAASASLSVSYNIRGASWSPLYDARLDTGAKDRKPSLELVRRAEIVQHTGEDWRDVTLSVSTVRTAKGGGAPDLKPIVVGYEPIEFVRQKVTRVEPANSAQRVQSTAVSASSFAEPSPMQKMDATEQRIPKSVQTKAVPVQKMEENEAAIETGGFQVSFRIPGRISLGASEGAKSLRIATEKTTAELLVRAVPALDDTPYLEATFKHSEEAPLLPGRVAIYRDGMFVGRGQMPLSPKEETVRLGFGADEKMKVARAIVRRNESSSGLLTSTKTDEREYKITVKNGHDSEMNVVVEDQIPVSEVDGIKVELLPDAAVPSEQNVRDHRGVLAWKFLAAAGESREINFGWRVSRPAEKKVVYRASDRDG